MKKIILLAATVLFSFSLLAQNRVITAKEAAKISAQQKIPTGKETFDNSEQNISTTPTILQRSSNDFIGSTYYDLQTNGTMPQRILAHEDGTVSFTWTTMKPQDDASRGSGYNYYDGSALLKPSNTDDRIENVRTGFTTIGTLTNGTSVGEVVIAHNGTTGLTISTSAIKGSGNWKQEILKGPKIPKKPTTADTTTSTTKLFWPSLATSGTTIHLIVCTDSDTTAFYEGINTCLLYYKGDYNFTNNAITWEEPRIVGDVTSSYIRQFGGDSYAITTNGDKVAILVCSSWLDNFYWLSQDNGVTWGGRQLIYKTAVPEFYSEKTTLVLDTPYVCDGNGAIAIGDNGVVHVALGITRVGNDVLGDGSYSFWPYVNGLLYWNSNKGQIPFDLADSAKRNLSPEILAEAGWQILKKPSLDGTATGTDFFLNVDNPLPSYGNGSTSMPQLLVKGNNVYLIYTSILHYPFFDETKNQHYRGIFAAKSSDNGNTWPAETDGVSWLSYDGKDLFSVDWEFYDTTYVDQNPDWLFPTFFESSENVFPAIAANIVEGKINMMWQNSKFPGKEVGGTNNVAVASQASNMYWFSIDADEIGTYNNTREVYKVESVRIAENSIKQTKIYPNPANNQVFIELSSTAANSATITITNVMGQTVMTQTENLQTGYNKFNFNISHLSNGFYLVNVNTPTGKVTQKLIIQ